jgi:hypothetical protein
MGKSKLTKTGKGETGHVKGIGHKEFVLAGQIVNSAYYCDILWGLHENVRRLQPELQRQKNWLLHRDSIPSHTPFSPGNLLPKTA